MILLKKIVDEISNIPSSNGKIEKLEEFIKEDKYKTAIDLLRIIYNPTMVTGISEKIADRILKINPLEANINDDRDVIDLVSTYYPKPLSMTLYVSDQDTKDFLIKVFKKNLEMGMNVKSINKALRNCDWMEIFNPPYMRCTTMKNVDISKDSGFPYPAFIQVKEDSEFVNIIISPEWDGIYLMSRNGKPSIQGEYLNQFAEKFFDLYGESALSKQGGFVIHGELMVRNASSRTDNRSQISSLTKAISTLQTLNERYISAKTDKSRNQILNQQDEYVHKWNKIFENLYISVWDIIPLEDWYTGKEYTFPYKHRLEMLVSLLKRRNLESDECDHTPLLHLTKTYMVYDEIEVMERFEEFRKKGLEGAILKTFEMKWKNGTSKEQIKIKQFYEFEMKVTGWNPGSGQFKDGIGSLDIESRDGKIKCSVTGMTLEMRGLERTDPNDSSKGLKKIKGFEPDQYIGKIVTVKATELSRAKNAETYSLYLPNIVKFRDDKDEADDFEYISALFNEK